MTKKRISNEVFIKHIDRYFYEINHEQIKCLKYTAIAEYLSRETGEEVPEYSIRRNHEIKQYIQKLKSQSSKILESKTIVFVPLDITNFISKNSNNSSLKIALVKRDQYYKGICELACRIYNEDILLNKKNSELIEANKALKVDFFKKQDQLNATFIEIKNLKIQLKRMQDILQQSVYPEIANELLREIGLINGGEDIINNETYTVMKATDSVIGVIKNNETKYSDNNVIQGLFEKI